MTKNKNILLLLLLFVASIGLSQSEKVKVEIDTTNIRIGEQFIYKISVNDTKKVIISELKLKGLEVVDSLKTDTIKNQLVKKYILTGFDSGAFYIPQQQIFIKNQAYFTDSLLVNVATVDVDTLIRKKFEIKGIKNEPYQVDDFRHLWWVLLIPLFVISFLLYWFVFRKKKEVIVEQKPSIPPYDLAVKQLKELDDKLLWQNNKTKQYYSELTEIIRTYIEDEFEVPALENTSDEIVKKLSRLHRKKQIIAPNESLNKLSNLLIISDLVKFAKAKPLSEEIQNARKDAEQIINNLKQKPKEEENVE